MEFRVSLEIQRNLVAYPGNSIYYSEKAQEKPKPNGFFVPLLIIIETT